MIITRFRSTTAATLLMLLAASLTVAGCGGSSKTPNGVTVTLNGRAAEVPFAAHQNPASLHALGKFVACMRTHGVKNFPDASKLSAASAATISRLNGTPTFEKASVRCYDSLLLALPEAKRKLADGSTINLVPYKVPSGSMEPTLPIGARAYLEPLSGTPRVGDIVVFNPPEDAQTQDCGPVPHVTGAHTLCAEAIPKESGIKFVKRIVAGPGDEIYIKNGHVYRNGLREHDPYIKLCGALPECNYPHEVKIPPGHWFMMGDNRGESDDSRFWGAIPTNWILGTVRRCSSIGPTCHLTAASAAG